MNISKLENNCVILKPMVLEDVEGIYKAGADERIWKHMSVCLTTREAVEQYVIQAIAEQEAGSAYPFVIIHPKDNEIIGATWFLDISMSHKRLEIGSTWLNPNYWQTEINTNCKYLLLKYCFEELQWNRVQIKTDHENVRSQKAIERIGAFKEGVLRNHMIRRNGTIRHTVMYSITSEEWPNLQKKFTLNYLERH